MQTKRVICRVNGVVHRISPYEFNQVARDLLCREMQRGFLLREIEFEVCKVPVQWPALIGVRDWPPACPEEGAIDLKCSIFDVSVAWEPAVRRALPEKARWLMRYAPEVLTWAATFAPNFLQEGAPLLDKKRRALWAFLGEKAPGGKAPTLRLATEFSKARIMGLVDYLAR